MRYATAPASPRFNVTANALSSTAILVNWDMVPPMEQNGLITQYQVLYQPLETFGEAIGEDTAFATGMTANLTGLQENVAYRISVQAYTSEGEGPYSDKVTATTNEDGKLTII